MTYAYYLAVALARDTHQDICTCARIVDGLLDERFDAEIPVSVPYPSELLWQRDRRAWSLQYEAWHDASEAAGKAWLDRYRHGEYTLMDYVQKHNLHALLGVN